MRKDTVVLAAALFLSALGREAHGENIIIDWEKRQLVSCPAEVDRNMTVEIRIDNVNNILYSYDVNVAAVEIVPSDGSLFAQLVGKGAGAAAAGPETKAAPTCLDDLRSKLATATKLMDDNPALAGC